MFKSISFGLFFITLSILDVSYKDVEGVETKGLREVLVHCIRKKVLDRTNSYRGKYGIGPLALKDELNNKAQARANFLASSTTLMIIHKLKNKYGENVIITRTLPNIGATVVDLWYNVIGIIDKDGGKSRLYTNENLGTMTQLLWKSSNEIGVGVSRSEDGYFFIVVKYNPMGNIDGLYAKNLPAFNQRNIEDGKIALQKFNLKNIGPIYISNLKTGQMIVPHEYVNIQDTGELVLSKLPKEYNSNMEPIGLSHAEASSIRKQVLERSNIYRKKHKIKKFKLSSKMNNWAQDWANQLALKEQLENRPYEQQIYGENKFSSSPILFGDFGEIAVDVWYNQIGRIGLNMREVDFFNAQIICLTQLLWKPSRKMGVGVSVDTRGHYYLVVNYKPKGNTPCHFIENLPFLKYKHIEAGAIEQAQLNEIAGKDFVSQQLPTWPEIILIKTVEN